MYMHAYMQMYVRVHVYCVCFFLLNTLNQTYHFYVPGKSNYIAFVS